MEIPINHFLRRHAQILLVLTFVASWYFVWTWNAALGDIGADGANYLMMAQHYSPIGGRDLVYQITATYSRFPPMYPLVLALTGAADDVGRAHIVTTLCFLIALLAFYVFLQREGMSTKLSSLLVLLFAILPGSYIIGLFLQSEYLYLFFSLLALTLMAVYRPGARREVLLGAALATGAAILTRTIGICLLVPLLVMLWRAPRRIAGAALLIALFPPIGWHLVHRSHAGYMEALRSSYNAGGLTFLCQQLAAELPALRKGFIDNFLLTEALRPLAYALGFFCLMGTAWRAFMLKPDAVYAVAYLAILLVWPYPNEAERFLWTLLPLLLAQPLLEFEQWRSKSTHAEPSQLFPIALAAVILIMALPAVAFTADRYRSAAYSDLPGAASFMFWYDTDPVAAEQIVATEISIINAMRWIPDHVPESDCVIAIRPDLINYFGRRSSVNPPPNSVPEPVFTAAIRDTGCHYLFGMTDIDSAFPIPFYPLQRLKPNFDPVYVSKSAERFRGFYPSVAVLAKLH